jgi:hypothetical protein
MQYYSADQLLETPKGKIYTLVSGKFLFFFLVLVLAFYSGLPFRLASVLFLRVRTGRYGNPL